ncbi:MAG TPA: hypothetical protein VFG63_17165 [Nocardioidaceae bacterium]|nr:hypothetical protein [Nocardioidaceae bacterium]
MWSSWRWCAGWLACALLVSCSAEQAAPPRTPDLDASITQFRNDEGTRNLRAGVTNGSDTTVTVSRATLDWAGFAPTSVDIDDWVLEPGRTAGFTMQYGDARCGADPDAVPSLVVLVDDVELRLPLEVQDPQLLVRLHGHECAQQRLDAAASVTLELDAEPVTRAGEEYLPGAVLVRRRSDAADGLQVVDLGGSVLLHLDPRQGPDALPVRLSTGRDTVRLPVLAGSAHRCDAHALGNSSQTFLLSVYVRLRGDPVQRVITVPDKESKARLTSLILRDCR